MFKLRAAFMIVIVLAAGPAMAGGVHINTADAAAIAQALDGVSLPQAQRIVAHRTRTGPFRSHAEIGRVPYVGAALVDRNRRCIVLD